MSDKHPTPDLTPLPHSVQRFLDDAATVLRIALDSGNDIKTITVSATYWPQGGMDVTGSWPKPRVRPT